MMHVSVAPIAADLGLFIAEQFGSLMALVAMIATGLALRTVLKLSLGTTSAGPMQVPKVDVDGLNGAAWDLEGIDTHLRRRPDDVRLMVRDLARVSAVAVPPLPGEVTAAEDEIDHYLLALEQALELVALQPITPSPPFPQPNESSSSQEPPR